MGARGASSAIPKSKRCEESYAQILVFEGSVIGSVVACGMARATAKRKV